MRSLAKTLYAGVDIGTSSVRVAILTHDGQIQGQAIEPIPIHRDKNDGRIFEQSVNDVWSALQRCFQVIAQSVDLTHVKALGLDATCSMVITDLQAHPLSVHKDCLGSTEDHRNILLWCDHRAETQAEAINATQHTELSALGSYMSLELDIPKIKWIKDHYQTGFENLAILSLADYIAFRLSGMLTNLTSLGEKGMATYVKPSIAYQPKHGFSVDFLKVIGLENMHINSAFTSQPGLPLPGTCPNAMKELGLPSEVIISCPVIDCYAGYVGTLAASSSAKQIERGFEQCASKLAAVAGTSTCLILESPINRGIQGVWGPFQDCIFAGWNMLMGSQSATGDLLSFLIDTHPATKDLVSDSESKFEVVQKALDQAIVSQHKKSAVDLAKDAFLYPDFRGNRCPLNDGEMKGLISGLQMDSSTLDLCIKYQIGMEGIALQMRHIIDSFRDAGHSIAEIYLSGSQALNTQLCQLIANVCMLPVICPLEPTLSVVSGSAQLARYAHEVLQREGMKIETLNAKAIALKYRDVLWSCMTSMTPEAKRLNPCASERDAAILQAKYETFKDSIVFQQKSRERMKRALSCLG